MRPAQLTPENARRGQQFGVDRRGFNEAGAINAGKRGGAPSTTTDKHGLQ